MKETTMHTTTNRSRWRAPLALLAVLTLVLAACGNDSDGDSKADGGSKNDGAAWNACWRLTRHDDDCD